MNILYLSYDGLTDPLGQSQILPYMVDLSRRGYTITIISFEKTERYSEVSKIRKIVNDERINWEPRTYHKRPTVLSTVYDIWIGWRSASNMIKKRGIGLLHCRSYLMSLIGFWAKRKFGTPFVFDMRGFWADERVEGDIWNIKNPLFKRIYSYIKNKELEFVKESKSTIALTHAAEAEIRTWPDVSNANISVIPCCVDIDHFDPENLEQADVSDLKIELGIAPSDYVLLYLGSLGTWYLLEPMLRFFEKLYSSNASARFLFVTHDKEVLAEILKQNHFTFPDSAIIVSSSDRKSVPLYVSLCNTSICFIKPSYSKMASSATKMAEALSMGKPIIVNNGWGDVEKIIEEQSEAGYLVKDFNQFKFDELLEKSKQEKMAGAIRQVALSHFDLKSGVQKYSDVYSE